MGAPYGAAPVCEKALAAITKMDAAAVRASAVRARFRRKNYILSVAEEF